MERGQKSYCDLVGNFWLEPSSAAQLLGGGNHLCVKKVTFGLSEKYKNKFEKMELVTNVNDTNFKEKLISNLYRTDLSKNVYEYRDGKTLRKKIINHFKQEGALPIIMDNKQYSYCLVGVTEDHAENYYYLFQDSHCFSLMNKDHSPREHTSI